MWLPRQDHSPLVMHVNSPPPYIEGSLILSSQLVIQTYIYDGYKSITMDDLEQLNLYRSILLKHTKDTKQSHPLGGSTELHVRWPNGATR